MKRFEHPSGRVLERHFWFFGWWGRFFAPTDIADGWSWGRVAPAWYWWLRKQWLFSDIIWRIDHSGGRISWGTAQEVCRILYADSLTWRRLTK